MQAPDNVRVEKLQSSYLQYLPALYRRELLVDLDAKQVWVAGEKVALRKQDFELLALLYQKQGSTCSEEEILAHMNLNSCETKAESKETIAELVAHVRKAIERDPTTPLYLKTIDGTGYRLDTDEFLGRFLLIFEDVLKPIEKMVDELAFYFDPLTAPNTLLPWLASWVDFVLDPKWPEHKRRLLIKRAAELYRWRGTKKGLAEYVRIYAGSVPEISEHMPGMRLSSDNRLGTNTILGSSGGGYHFTVTIELDRNSSVSEHEIRSIIESQKPAHTIYTLRILKHNKPELEDSHGAK